MNIKRHNMDKDRVFTTTGPTVEFELSDGGQANVTINLRLSDGTHLHYPTGMGKSQLESSTIARGRYRAVVTISAVDMKVFGKTYDSRLSIGGKKAVSATGSIPETVEVDQDFDLFFLQVD